MKNECGPDKQQDIAETAPQISGGQRNPFQNKLPADGIYSEDDHGQAEPEKISGGKGVVAL